MVVTEAAPLAAAPQPPQLSLGDAAVRLLAVLSLIAINAFFVTAEFAMVAVRRSRISQLVEAGDVQAQTVQALQRSIERLLSTTQLGITLSSLALGWIGERTMAVLVEAGLLRLPVAEPTARFLSHSVAVPVAFLLVAYLQIVLGELCPKSIALLRAEQLSRVLGPPSLLLARLVHPFVWILNQSTRLLLRLAGFRDAQQGWHNRVTSEELQLIVATERESTGLEADERTLLNNVFEFGEVLTEEIMVPRPQIVSLPSEATFGMLLDRVAAEGYSRYPVTGESLDDIRGLIDFKEMAVPLAQNTIAHQSPIQAWIRPVRFVPAFTPLNELLSLMQRSRQETFIVVDEFGGTAGLVTLKDLMDEIIGGETESEDSEALTIQMLDEQTFLVQAQMDLDEINDLLDLDLPATDEYQTLGGFLLYQFQKIPTQGETLRSGDLDMTVMSAEGPRLYEIRIHRREPPTQSLPPSSERERPDPENGSGADSASADGPPPAS